MRHVSASRPHQRRCDCTSEFSTWRTAAAGAWIFWPGGCLPPAFWWRWPCLATSLPPLTRRVRKFPTFWGRPDPGSHNNCTRPWRRRLCPPRRLVRAGAVASEHQPAGMVGPVARLGHAAAMLQRHCRLHRSRPARRTFERQRRAPGRLLAVLLEEQFGPVGAVLVFAACLSLGMVLALDFLLLAAWRCGKHVAIWTGKACRACCRCTATAARWLRVWHPAAAVEIRRLGSTLAADDATAETAVAEESEALPIHHAEGSDADDPAPRILPINRPQVVPDDERFADFELPPADAAGRAAAVPLRGARSAAARAGRPAGKDLQGFRPQRPRRRHQHRAGHHAVRGRPGNRPARQQGHPPGATTSP